MTLLARDPSLRRQLLFRLSTDSSYLATQKRRDMARPGRLRWIGRGREEAWHWDCYVLPSYCTFTAFARERATFSVVHRFLDSLLEELIFAVTDDSLPAELSLGQVLVLDDGQALILDWPTHRRSFEIIFRHQDPAQRALNLPRAVASTLISDRIESARGGMPLPLYATELLVDISGKAVPPSPYARHLIPRSIEPGLDGLRRELIRESDKPKEITAARRLAPGLLFSLVMCWLYVEVFFDWKRAALETEFRNFRHLTQVEAALDDPLVAERILSQIEAHDARPVVTFELGEAILRAEHDLGWWVPIVWPGTFKEYVNIHRQFHGRAVSPEPQFVSYEQRSKAWRALGIAENRKSWLSTVDTMMPRHWNRVILLFVLAIMIGLNTLIGVAIVDSRGRPLTLWGLQALRFILVIGPPALLGGFATYCLVPQGNGGLGAPATGSWLLTCLLAYSVFYIIQMIRSPQRSWPDKLCGTYLVPM